MTIQEIRKAVIGKDECIFKVMTAILAGGHILLEDIPGVGKTTMAMAFSRAMDLQQKRVQFTPDVLPADITGFSMYQKETGQFVYQPGAAMCNLLLADEINRTSPKTQSALLEVMEEGRVSVDGVSRPVPDPFIVIATENPFGSAGTQLLPESQVDRFMICISMGYPDIRSEIQIAKENVSHSAGRDVQPVMRAAELLEMRKLVEGLFVHDVLYQYIAKLVQATRNHPLIDLGLSPRGTISITRMAKARAFLMGRTYVIPEDITEVYLDVSCHRIRLNSRARMNHADAESVLREILTQTPRPTVRRKKEL